MIFNSTEREGVLVMLLLITGLIVIPRFVRSGKPAFFLLPEVINIEKDSLRPVSHREISPPLELNTADSSALVRIRGIGPYYASKIINVEFFTVLILTTMLSSMIAGYWLRYQQKKDPEVFIKLTKEEGGDGRLAHQKQS